MTQDATRDPAPDVAGSPEQIMAMASATPISRGSR